MYKFSSESIRPLRETERWLQDEGLPETEFRHKWTGEQRLYGVRDVQIPKNLYYSGKLPNFDRPVVGIGGTRSPHVETFCIVSDIARRLSLETIIVSGGVPGVDLAAHIGALDTVGGSTIAVLANPPDQGLAGHEWQSLVLEEKIVQRGAFCSEYETFTAPHSLAWRERLLARDRIITGMSDVFVVFECSEGSATVDSAKRALLQGKSVIAVKEPKISTRKGVDELASIDTVMVLEYEKVGVEGVADTILGKIHKRRSVKMGS